VVGVGLAAGIDSAGVAVAAGVEAGVAAGVEAGVAAGVEAGVAAGVEEGVAAGVEAGVAAGVATGFGVSGCAGGAVGWVGLHEERKATAAAKVSAMEDALFISKEAFLRTGRNSTPVEICIFRFTALDGRVIVTVCSRGGTGRRVRLRSAWGNPWRFESSREHGSNFQFSDMKSPPQRTQ
jgi:hypothetical protein